MMLQGYPLLNESIAYLECKVIEKVGVGSHWLFIGEFVNAQILDDAFEPLTYAYYRKVKKGTAPKNAPIFIDKSKLKQNADKEKIKCTACSYFYDESKEDAKFSGLPDSWKCPVCRLGKEDFIKF